MHSSGRQEIYFFAICSRGPRIEEGTLDEAREALDDLEAADVHEQFINHRRATFLLKRVRTRDAAREAAGYAERACAIDNPPAEAFLVLANALIECGEFARATEAISRVEHRYPDTSNRDVVIGLRCKLANRRGDWRTAESQYQRLRKKSLPVHQGLRAAMLEHKLSDDSVLLSERSVAEAELARIRRTAGDAEFPTLVTADDTRTLLAVMETDC